MLRDEGKCSLQLKQVTPKDEGEYSIVAENGAGRAQCTCQLLIDDCEFFCHLLLCDFCLALFNSPLAFQNFYFCSSFLGWLQSFLDRRRIFKKNSKFLSTFFRSTQLKDDFLSSLKSL